MFVVGDPCVSAALLSISMNHSLTIRTVSCQTNALFASLNAVFVMARCLFHSVPSRPTMLGPYIVRTWYWEGRDEGFHIADKVAIHTASTSLRKVDLSEQIVLMASASANQ